MGALCHARLILAPLLLFCQRMLPVASSEDHVSSVVDLESRGAEFPVGKAKRRLSDAFTVQQKHHFRVRSSGHLDVELTVTLFPSTSASLSQVSVPIMSDTDMHCLRGDPAVTDSLGRAVTAKKSIAGNYLMSSLELPTDLGSKEYTAHLRYTILTGICETTDGGPKRFYFPWAQGWSGGTGTVNGTSYLIEFPDEPLDVSMFVCLGARDLETKCATQLGRTDNGVLQYEVKRFLNDAFFEWEMPRSPSQGRVCPPKPGNGAGLRGECVMEVANGKVAKTEVATSAQGPEKAKQVMLFIVAAGSVLAVSIILGEICKTKAPAPKSSDEGAMDNGGGVGLTPEQIAGTGNNGRAGNVSSAEAIQTPEGHTHKLSKVAYVGYSLLLFFAYWFGAHRFDYDGDGDFDTYDVQRYLEDKGILRRQFIRTSRRGQGTPRTPQGVSKPRVWQAWRRNKSPEDTDSNESPEDSKDSEDGIDLDDVDIEDPNFDQKRSKESEQSFDDQEEIVTERLLKGQARPWFILLQCVLAGLLWIIFASKSAAEGKSSWFGAQAGLEPIKTFNLVLTDITTCEDLRPQIWRLLTYQFIHAGWSHILFNVILTLVLGIPLEGAHGPWRMWAMYNVGVFGGACACLLSTPRTPTVGMSGGCYSLFGIHLADLMVNWHSKKYRIPSLVFLSVMALSDILQYTISGDPSTSHSTHFGGYIAGMLIGLLICRSYNGGKAERWEHALRLSSVFLGVCLLMFAILWSYAYWPPRDLWDSTSWCWGRAVSNPQIFGTNEWQCIRCAHQSCIDTWSAERYIRNINVDWCSDRGWFDGE